MNILAIEHLKRKYAKSAEESYYTKDNLLNEIWKPMIIEHKGNTFSSEKYIVSNYGRVKNIQTNEFMKLYKHVEGYVHVDLKEFGDRLFKKVHRLVALTFIENPNNLPQVNHKKYGDEFKDFNHVDNLEWCTSAENMKHKFNSTGREVFTMEELLKIKELLQIPNWSSSSILEEVGYTEENRIPRLTAISEIIRGKSHKDIFSDITIAKKDEVMDKETIHQICKLLSTIDDWNYDIIINKMNFDKSERTRYQDMISKIYHRKRHAKTSKNYIFKLPKLK